MYDEGIVPAEISEGSRTSISVSAPLVRMPCSNSVFVMTPKSKQDDLENIAFFRKKEIAAYGKKYRFS